VEKDQLTIKAKETGCREQYPIVLFSNSWSCMLHFSDELHWFPVTFSTHLLLKYCIVFKYLCSSPPSVERMAYL